MKHASKLAFLAAAGMGMAAGSAQAAEFEVADGTTLILGGDIQVQYLYEKKTDSNNDQKLKDAGSEIELGAILDVGNGISAYADVEFEFDVLGNNNDAVDRDSSVFGFVGDFGEFAMGDSDTLYDDAIQDATDPFDSASFSSASDTSNQSMVTYYSPDMDGFSFALQGRHKNRDNQSAKISLLGSVEYQVGNVLLAAAYDSRGAKDATDGSDFKSQDHLVGLSAIADVTDQLELSFKLAQENDQAGNDTDYTAIAAVYDYGPGDVYGAAQNVDPNNGDSRNETGVGIDYEMFNNVDVYAEYGDLDRRIDGTIQQSNPDVSKQAIIGLNIAY